MSTLHYVAFVAPTRSLSDELKLISKSYGFIRIIAPVTSKDSIGLTYRALIRVTEELREQLERDGNPRLPARLSVWAYEPTYPNQFELLWDLFGRPGWVEFIPKNYRNQDRKTRIHIEEKLAQVQHNLHIISYELNSRRRTSSIPLPFRNFRSGVLDAYAPHWYLQLSKDEISRFVLSTNEQFRQAHTRKDPDDGGHGVFHVDDNDLRFRPAKNEACHGFPHPVAETIACYLKGRFRFGAAIYPGHHYDVTPKNGNLSGTLFDCIGNARNMRSEKRPYINVFPNDHLLPEADQKQNRAQ